MNSLEELKAAATKLPAPQKQQLFFFLLSQLESAEGGLPSPREFTPEQIATWIREDEVEWLNVPKGA